MIIFSAAGNVRHLNIERSIREFGRAYALTAASLLLSFFSDVFLFLLRKKIHESD